MKRMILSAAGVMVPFLIAGVWFMVHRAPAPVPATPPNTISVNLVSAGALVWLCDTEHTIGTEIKCTDGNTILISDEVRKWIVPSTRRMIK